MENNEVLEDNEYKKLQRKISRLKIIRNVIIGIIIFGIVVTSIYLIYVEFIDIGGVLPDEEITSFNNQFSPYEGSKIHGSQVNALIDVVNANNKSGDRKVEIELDGLEEDVDYTGTISEEDGYTTYNYEFYGFYYSVTAENPEGYITKLIITKSE